jgi:hypothetical protein
MTHSVETRFDLTDGRQKITFTGVKLSAASSQTDSNPQARWTELAIYKTSAGRYVLEKIGRSDMFHEPGCSKFGKGALHYDALGDALDELDPDASPEEYFLPCPDCRPSYDLDEPVVVEQDMHKVDAFASPSELVEALYHRKGGTVRSLSYLSRSLLEQAALLDEGIAEELKKPVEIT